MERILSRSGRKASVFSPMGVWAVLFVCVLILFLSFPNGVRKGVTDGLSLCLSAVIPALFPFAVLSSFFVKMNLPKWVARPFAGLSKALFGMRGEIFSLWLTGLVAGFPIGGRTAVGLYRSGAITKREGELGAAFSNCPSPAFVISFCGGLFDSPLAGVLLFSLISISSLLCGVIMCRIFKQDSEDLRSVALSSSRPSALSALSESCVSGWEAINTVCSFVIFFSALLALGEELMGNIILSDAGKPLFRGAFELTAGISALADSNFSVYWRFVFAAFILSFSGLCANMQVICFLREEKMDIAPYVIGRTLIVVICTGLSFAVGLLL